MTIPEYGIGSDMTFKSHRSYRDFEQTVRQCFRYARTPEQEEFLRIVTTTSASRSVTMKAGHVLWRAQLGHDWRMQEQHGESFEIPTAFPTERMKPLSERASDGRANPKGIACLYLASQRETAALEVRPLIGSYISVAQFEVIRDVRLVDCSAREIGKLAFLEPNLTQEDIEKIVWSDINTAFSEPVERGDESVDYVATQVIAETFKLAGFDGIAYKSGYGEDGFNVALFDLAASELVTRQLHRVKDVSVKLSEEEEPYFKRQKGN